MGKTLHSQQAMGQEAQACRSSPEQHEQGAQGESFKGITGVVKQPVSKQHMPNLLQGSTRKGGSEKQQKWREQVERVARVAAIDEVINMTEAEIEVEKLGGNKGATPVGLFGRAAPEPAVSLRKQGEPHGWSLSDEGCLLTPGLGPNSQLAPLGEAGRALAERQPAEAVASPEPARVTVWATETVQNAPQAAAPEPDKVMAGAAASVSRVVNPLFRHERDSTVCTSNVHIPKITGAAVPEPARVKVRAAALRVDNPLFEQTTTQDIGADTPDMDAPKIDTPRIDAGVQMAVPEPVRAMVRATGAFSASVGVLGLSPGDYGTWWTRKFRWEFNSKQ